MIKLKQEGFYWIQMVKRLALIFLLFSLIRGCFFLYNQGSFPEVSTAELTKIFFYALRFDAAAIIYINGLFILGSLLPIPWRRQAFYQKMLLWFYLLPNAIALGFELIDIGFFRFAFRRTIGSDLSLFQNTAGMIPSFVAEYWYLLVLFAGLLYLLYYWFRKTQKPFPSTQALPQWSIFLLSCLLFGIGARGGLQLRPLMPLTAANYVSDMRLIPLMTNTSLHLIFSSQQRFLKEKNYFSEANLEQHFSLHRHYVENSGIRGKNVLIIVLESFGQEHVGFYTPQEKSYTPFLDSLIQKGTYFEESFANGLRSTQGIVSITAGIPALMNDPLMFSAYQSNQVAGLAQILGAEGYQTAFFHGANPGSMEFERFSKLTGFQSYHDRRSYPEPADYDGQWGIWDAPFFQYTAQSINQFDKPFCALLFSLTSHHPYRVPADFEQQYPEEPKLLRSVRYTDHALRTFFETAQKMPWYENTLFVITADHIGKGKKAFYKTKLGKFRIPIILFDPLQETAGQEKGFIQQIDIMPTVLDYLGYNQPFRCFGYSALREDRPNLAYQYSSNLFQIADSTHCLLFDEHQTIGLYNYQQDALLQENLTGTLPPIQSRLEEQLKAIIQVHHRAMVRNEL